MDASKLAGSHMQLESVEMLLDISHLVLFIVGALSGAAGQYLYMDKRRKKEAAKEVNDLKLRIEKLMPELVEEIRVDINSEGFETVRELVVLPNERFPFFNGGKDKLAYFESNIDNLTGKLQILQDEGLIVDVTETNTPTFRLTEEFIGMFK